jgi:hypothetical protein
MSEAMMYAPDYMRSLNDKQLDACADLMEKYIAEKQNKLKRTISLEAYIKMQCDVALKTAEHISDPETIVTLAKKSVDRLLKHNNVEVED